MGLIVPAMLPVPALDQTHTVKSEALIGTWGRTYQEEKAVAVRRDSLRFDTVTVSDTLVFNADSALRRVVPENGKPQDNIVTKLKWSLTPDTLWTYNKFVSRFFSIDMLEDGGRKMTLGRELITEAKRKDGQKARKIFQSLARNDEPRTRVGRYPPARTVAILAAVNGEESPRTAPSSHSAMSRERCTELNFNTRQS